MRFAVLIDEGDVDLAVAVEVGRDRCSGRRIGPVACELPL